MSEADENRALIRSLYEAFDRGDGEAMAACYAPGARFEDPVFGELTGEQAGAMWRMFTSRPDSDLRVELAEHDATESTAAARWVARYSFGPTGRSVVNEIQASFRIADGRIVEHVDDFSFWTWSRQALGLPGLLLGWTPFLRLALRRKARADLERFMRGEPVEP